MGLSAALKYVAGTKALVLSMFKEMIFSCPDESKCGAGQTGSDGLQLLKPTWFMSK